MKQFIKDLWHSDWVIIHLNKKVVYILLITFALRQFYVWSFMKGAQTVIDYINAPEPQKTETY